MRNLLSLVAIGFAILFSSCAEETINIIKHDDLTITTEVPIIVDADGGKVNIGYTISEDAKSDVISITCDVNWINSFDKSTAGIIIVDVARNNSGDDRTATIEISLGNEVETVYLVQKKDDNGNGGNQDDTITFKALCLDGYYYGQKYGEGADRYAFFLSDQGLNNAGQAYTNGTYYYIDAFANVTGSATLPNGIYHFDSKNSGAPQTINSENSQLILTGESVENTTKHYLENATMMVSDNNIVLEVIIDGKTHKVTYTGSLELEDATEDNGGNEGGNDNPTGGQDKDAQSTLTGDRNVTFDGEHRVKWTYDGDYWQTGYSNYTIMMMNKYNGYVFGDTLQLDIITDNTSKNGDFYGTYKCSYTPGKNVLMAGFTNDYAQAVGTWLFDYSNGGAAYNSYAMIVDGELTITDAGNGNSTIVLNAVDCLDNKITCNWTGVIEED